MTPSPGGAAPQKGSSETSSRCQGRQETPRGHLEGDSLWGLSRLAARDGQAMGEGLLGKGPLAPPGSKAGGKRPGLWASRLRLSHLSPTCLAPLPSQRGGQDRARWVSYEDLGQGISACTGNKGLAGVAGDSVDGLLVLLAVGRDLLHAGFVV